MERMNRREQETEESKANCIDEAVELIDITDTEYETETEKTESRDQHDENPDNFFDPVQNMLAEVDPTLGEIRSAAQNQATALARLISEFKVDGKQLCAFVGCVLLMRQYQNRRFVRSQIHNFCKTLYQNADLTPQRQTAVLAFACACLTNISVVMAIAAIHTGRLLNFPHMDLADVLQSWKHLATHIGKRPDNVNAIITLVCSLANSVRANSQLPLTHPNTLFCQAFAPDGDYTLHITEFLRHNGVSVVITGPVSRSKPSLRRSPPGRNSKRINFLDS